MVLVNLKGCLDRMYVVDPPLQEVVALVFDINGTPVNIGGGYTSFIDTTFPDYCPITSCELRTVTADTFECTSTPFTHPYISMASTDPYLITAIPNRGAGYSVRMCVACTNYGSLELTKTQHVWLPTCNTDMTASQASVSA